MKKMFCLFVILALPFMCTGAWAATYTALHTTSSGSSTITDDSILYPFEQPYLYWQVTPTPESQPGSLVSLVSTWNSPTGDHYEFSSGSPSISHWITPSGTNSWSTIAEPGDWTINAAYDLSGYHSSCYLGMCFPIGYTDSADASTGFNVTFYSVPGGPSSVTPEPISMALFALGGGALGLTRMRRKK